MVLDIHATTSDEEQWISDRTSSVELPTALALTLDENRPWLCRCNTNRNGNSHRCRQRWWGVHASYGSCFCWNHDHHARKGRSDRSNNHYSHYTETSCLTCSRWDVDYYSCDKNVIPGTVMTPQTKQISFFWKFKIEPMYWIESMSTWTTSAV